MEQVLSSCCGFLHDCNEKTEPAMIERFLNTTSKYGENYELNGIKRRAFLITSTPVEDRSVELVPGWYGMTMTPWSPENVEEMPTDARHVNNYKVFKHELILNKTVLNIAGFDGDVDSRQEFFDKLASAYPELPIICILSNSQHENGEPFLIKNGFKPVLRGCNRYWYNNHLTIFTRNASVAKSVAA